MTQRTSLTFSWYVSSPFDSKFCYSSPMLALKFESSYDCLHLDWWHVMLHVHFDIFEGECSYS